MTHDEKIKCMRLAANLCNFGFNEEQMDLLVTLYDSLLKKGSSMNLADVVQIELDVKSRLNVKQRSSLLDKVSVKV